MACNTINSSIGIFTLAILAVLIVAVALGDDTRRSRMAFAAVLTLHAVNTFGGLLAQRFTGLDDTFSIMMTYIGNYGTYMVGPVAVTGFILLACANLPTDLSPKARRTTTGLIVTPGVLNMLLIILNLWTGWVFRIGEGNAFAWGPLHMLPDDMAALQILVSLLVVPLANAGGAKHVLLQWLALFMLPIAAGIVENRHDSLTLMYPAIAFSLMILFILRRQSNEERRILAEHELAESKAKLFTEQLHPHFIFNSLTAIQELCMEDSTRARKAVQELSVYLRGNIDAVGESQLVPVRKEIQHVKAYLGLVQTDTPHSIKISWNIRTLDFRLPPLSMQPLVEHAVKFHLPYAYDPALVIKVWHDDVADYISVHDDVESECPEEADHHTASLDRVAKRLGIICNGSLTYASDHGTTLTITIPKGGNA